jgi:hypothetical protein
MNKFKVAVVCGAILFSSDLHSQEMPLGSLPMLYNGGFAGEAGEARFNTGVGIRKSNFSDSNLTLSYLSYDQFIPKVRTGIGITLVTGHMDVRDTLSLEYDGINSTSVITSLSPKFSSNGKYTLAPFVDFKYTYSYYKLGDLTSGLYLKPGWNTSLRTGILLNSKKYYVGFTLEGLRSDTRKFNDFPDMPIGSAFPGKKLIESLVIQAGYTFQRLPESRFSFTPHVAYTYSPSHGKLRSTPLFVNLMFRYNKFLWSLNSNGLGIGFQNERFRIMLSQNFNTKGNLTMRFVLKK